MCRALFTPCLCKRFYLFLVLLMSVWFKAGIISSTDDVIHQPCFMEIQTTSRLQLVVPWLGEKFLAFYGFCRFIMVFTTTHHFSVSSAYPSPHLPILYLNVIIPSITGSPKLSLFSRFCHHHAVYTSYFSPCNLHCAVLSSLVLLLPPP
jgi:hypothetical protein